MHFKMLSAICLNLDQQSKNLLSGNGLRLKSHKIGERHVGNPESFLGDFLINNDSLL